MVKIAESRTIGIKEGEKSSFEFKTVKIKVVWEYGQKEKGTGQARVDRKWGKIEDWEESQDAKDIEYSYFWQKSPNVAEVMGASKKLPDNGGKACPPKLSPKSNVISSTTGDWSKTVMVGNKDLMSLKVLKRIGTIEIGND